MGVMDMLKKVTLREPVLTLSCLLGAIGLILPAVVPPIRNALSSSEPVKPPKLSEVVSGMTGKSQQQ